MVHFFLSLSLWKQMRHRSLVRICDVLISMLLEAFPNSVKSCTLNCVYFSTFTASPYARIKLEQKLSENCCKPLCQGQGQGQREPQRSMGLKFPYMDRGCTSGGSSFQDTPSPSGSTASSVSGKDSVSSRENRRDPVGQNQPTPIDGTGNYPPADIR